MNFFNNKIEILLNYLMQCLDKICLTTFNKFCLITKFLSKPAKAICKILTVNFERPYSLCFLLNFFILITPLLLLTVMLTQYSVYFPSLENFNLIFYTVLINLITNFVSVFHIYDLYGRHSLEEGKLLYTVSSFIKQTLNYLFKETKLGYIGIYYILQVGVYCASLIYLFGKSDFNSENFEFPVLIIFTKFALICSLVFTISHVVIYVSLFFVILCSINKSCLCGLCLDGNVIEKAKNSNKIQVGNKDNHVTDRNTNGFFLIILECYKFLGLFDYKQYLEIEYIETENQNDSKNEV